MYGTYFIFTGDFMKRILIVGGDRRLKILKNHLEKENFYVDSLGLFPDDKGDISKSDIVIFPVPTTKDGETVFCPLTNRKIYLNEIKPLIENQLILCCNYKFEDKNFIDYNTLDSFAILNAVPTAEGAIEIIIRETEYTLWQSKILVIGYGRVGKIMADRLKNLGADVTVSARKPRDFAFLSALGFKDINTEKIGDIYLDYNIIINTVDHPVLSDKVLEHCPADLLIDLSSKGGFNLSYAKALGFKAFKPGGIPALTAPVTAGNILAKTVTDIIKHHN